MIYLAFFSFLQEYRLLRQVNSIIIHHSQFVCGSQPFPTVLSFLLPYPWPSSFDPYGLWPPPVVLHYTLQPVPTPHTLLIPPMVQCIHSTDRGVIYPARWSEPSWPVPKWFALQRTFFLALSPLSLWGLQWVRNTGIRYQVFHMMISLSYPISLGTQELGHSKSIVFRDPEGSCDIKMVVRDHDLLAQYAAQSLLSSGSYLALLVRQSDISPGLSLANKGRGQTSLFLLGSLLYFFNFKFINFFRHVIYLYSIVLTMIIEPITKS